MRGNFDNTGRLVRFFLRRERVNSIVWLVMLSGFSIILTPFLGQMFDEQARTSMVEMVSNPAMIAMMGVPYGIENYTAGAMYGNMILIWTMIAVAVMNILLVVRHTRNDEENGRAEVVRSLPTGRLATLGATMIVAVIVNTALAICTGLGVAVWGVEGMGLGPSMLYGFQLGIGGLFFAGAAAVFSQLSQSSRGATGLSFGTLAAVYMMRAVGDMSSEALSLISPMGLLQRAQVFVNNYWWPLLIVIFEVLAVTVLAFILNRVRDIDQGFIPAKPGRQTASVFLRSPLGLSFRLLRTSLIVWVVGIFMLGASYASILGQIDEFVASSEFYAAIIGMMPGYTTAQMFVSMVTSIGALFAAVPALMSILRLHSEEQDGRIENILSRVVSRQKYMAGYTLVALVSSVVLQCATAAGIYLVASMTLSNPADLSLGYLLKANLVYLPAIWVMLGITIFLIGFIPKRTRIIWGYFGFSAFMALAGRMPDLFPEWVSKLQPFGYIPQLPVDEIHYPTLVIMAVIAIALAAAGFVFYRKRDMVSG